jgi:hypothetical protein
MTARCRSAGIFDYKYFRVFVLKLKEANQARSEHSDDFSPISSLSDFSYPDLNLSTNIIYIRMNFYKKFFGAFSFIV